MSKEANADDVLVEVWGKPDPFFTTIGKRFVMSVPGRLNPWRVAPEDKKKSTHKLASTRDALIAVFPNAIAIGSPVAANKSFAGFGGMMIAAIGCMMWLMLAVLLDDMLGRLTVVTFFVLTALYFWWSFRSLYRSVSDWPVVFNRKTRQVTYLPSLLMPFWKFWKSPKQEWLTANWDDVKVRTYKYVDTNAGRSFHDSYNFFLLWGEAGEPHTLRDYVSIGYQGYFEDETMWMLWEHIRRYMEEDGPAIPHGEELRTKTHGKPVAYPPELIAATGGPAFSAEVVTQMAE